MAKMVNCYVTFISKKKICFKKQFVELYLCLWNITVVTTNTDSENRHPGFEPRLPM